MFSESSGIKKKLMPTAGKIQHRSARLSLSPKTELVHSCLQLSERLLRKVVSFVLNDSLYLKTFSLSSSSSYKTVSLTRVGDPTCNNCQRCYCPQGLNRCFSV